MTTESFAVAAPTYFGGDSLVQGNGYHRTPFVAGQVERIGLPGIAVSDGPRGAVIGNATCFAVTMAPGATWDLDLEERIGEAIGRELQSAAFEIAVGLDRFATRNIEAHCWSRPSGTHGPLTAAGPGACSPFHKRCIDVVTRPRVRPRALHYVFA